jgi:hypothetical protein
MNFTNSDTYQLSPLNKEVVNEIVADYFRRNENITDNQESFKEYIKNRLTFYDVSTEEGNLLFNQYNDHAVIFEKYADEVQTFYANQKLASEIAEYLATKHGDLYNNIGSTILAKLATNFVNEQNPDQFIATLLKPISSENEIFNNILLSVDKEYGEILEKLSSVTKPKNANSNRNSKREVWRGGANGFWDKVKSLGSTVATKSQDIVSKVVTTSKEIVVGIACAFYYVGLVAFMYVFVEAGAGKFLWYFQLLIVLLGFVTVDLFTFGFFPGALLAIHYASLMWDLRDEVTGEKQLHSRYTMTTGKVTTLVWPVPGRKLYFYFVEDGSYVGPKLFDEYLFAVKLYKKYKSESGSIKSSSNWYTENQEDIYKLFREEYFEVADKEFAEYIKLVNDYANDKISKEEMEKMAATYKKNPTRKLHMFIKLCKNYDSKTKTFTDTSSLMNISNEYFDKTFIIDDIKKKAVEVSSLMTPPKYEIPGFNEFKKQILQKFNKDVEKIEILSVETQTGGKTKKLYVLGRQRNVIVKGKKEYVTYNKTLITLSQARKIEMRKMRQSTTIKKTKTSTKAAR